MPFFGSGTNVKVSTSLSGGWTKGPSKLPYNTNNYTTSCFLRQISRNGMFLICECSHCLWSCYYANFISAVN